MDAPRWLPDPLEACALPDDDFARAYDQAGEEVRAGLKTCLAALFALHPPTRRASRVIREDLDLGLRVVRRATPLQAAVVLFGPEPPEPARILAALQPAVAAGVADIVAVRSAEAPPPWPAPVLAGLELAGQEWVLDCSPAQTRELLDALPGDGASACLDLGLAPSAAAALGLARPGLKLWRADASPAAAVSRAPGWEACWVWPDLDPSFFVRRAVSLEPASDDTPIPPQERA
jgi:hypothetical protein